MMSQSKQQLPPATALASSVQIWADTDPGKRREANEDNVYPRAGASRGPIRVGADKLAAKGHLAIVADGVGGAQVGSRVSERAVQYVSDGYYDGQFPDAGVNLKKAVESANHWLYDLIRRDPAFGHAATTLTAAALLGGKIHVAHVGDSRAYLIRSGQISQITKDHTLAQEKFEAGQIQQREDIPQDPGHSTLTRSLGTSPHVQVDMIQQALEPGDVVVLCSDGLYDEIHDDEIRAVAEREPPKKAVNTLIRRANRAGGNDNISVAVARLSGGSQATGWTAWQQAIALFLFVAVVAMMVGLAVIVVRDLWEGKGTDQTPIVASSTVTIGGGGTASPAAYTAVAEVPAGSPSPRLPTSTPILETATEPTSTPDQPGQYGRPWQKRTPTATRRAMATATATPNPRVPAPVLLDPKPDELLSGNRRFVWQWNHGELAEGLAFDLLICSEEEKARNWKACNGVIPPQRETWAEVDVGGVATVVEHGEGTYYWTVIVVVKGKPDRIGEWGELRPFVFQPPPLPTDTPIPTPVPPTQTPVPPTQTPVPPTPTATKPLGATATPTTPTY